MGTFLTCGRSAMVKIWRGRKQVVG
uniref:Uncharacterized protein n=1 Tax=Anguilla anguilla TaxID=7936 RepID=A0A0E9V565_ANGAN